ncbi:phosphatase 2C [Musa troglodytarum]|nr:phosphatase 2C [Musa troglodytarum]
MDSVTSQSAAALIQGGRDRCRCLVRLDAVAAATRLFVYGMTRLKCSASSSSLDFVFSGTQCSPSEPVARWKEQQQQRSDGDHGGASGCISSTENIGFRFREAKQRRAATEDEEASHGRRESPSMWIVSCTQPSLILAEKEERGRGSDRRDQWIDVVGWRKVLWGGTSEVEALMDLLRYCWGPSLAHYVNSGSDAVGRRDGLLWHKDSGRHACGEFSMAVVQANDLLEDQSQIESGPLSSPESGLYGTFVGIYDGHGGPETSRYVNDHLFHHLKSKVLPPEANPSSSASLLFLLIASVAAGENLPAFNPLPSPFELCMPNVQTGFALEQQTISVDVIRKAIQATEEGFLALVTKQWPAKPQIAAVGSCCLLGVICSGTLYIANLGDSRVVLGRLVKATGEVLAMQLSAEHNAGLESVRQELCSLHPNDPRIVVLKHDVWRVKGLIQVSRTIGDAYLKRAEFNREPLQAKFCLGEPFKKPILGSEPSISAQPLQREDQFLIFASDGLWEHLSNQEAVDIVQHHPRSGSARRLVRAALRAAAKKREIRCSDLEKINRGVRRHFHDDMTVIVVFLDSNLASRASSIRGPKTSIRGGGIGLPPNSRTPYAKLIHHNNS